MPRPRTFCCSSMTTAFVVVEPRSMPMKQRMRVSRSVCERRRVAPRREDRPLRRQRSGASRKRGGDTTGRALLLDHLEVAFQPVLDVGGREIPRIDEIRLDECRRLAGALLDLTQDQELAGR